MKLNDFNLQNIEEVGSYVKHSVIEDRTKYHTFIDPVDGRETSKKGILQAVTFVGVKYHIGNGKYVLRVGIGYQNPCDLKVDKHVGIEAGAIAARENPAIIMEVPKRFRQHDFARLMTAYYYEAIESELAFVKTSKEVQNKK